jgi:hypothetical protein
LREKRRWVIYIKSENEYSQIAAEEENEGRWEEEKEEKLIF